MKRLLPYFLFCGLLLLTACGTKKEAPLFKLLDAGSTGIEFANELTESDSLIALSFEYLYNGCGVAIGDFNQDGLSDVFFPGNMVSSRLYLNKGGLQFEDITEKSKINTTNKWASGAAVVDLNQDGWPDIYLCVGGLSPKKEKRANLLYINQKDGTFSEEAAAYGLDDPGYSINAAFFDYDKDGDLDLYLLTTELDPYNWREFRPRRIQGEAPNNDKLYRNNGDQTFTNVSKESGILIEGYGLGLAVCDINEDSWPDLYIANDFFSSDVIYINNQDGTFSNRIDDYLSHTSRNSMGTDLQDFNNDGLVDIMVLDMLPSNNQRQKSMFGFFNYDKYRLGLRNGYHPQFPRNTLQKNNGNGTFSEIGQLAGVHQTDWSWSALFADFDNDGWQDLFITNGYRQDLTNMDFATYSRQLTSSPIGTQKAKEKKMFEKLKALPEIKIHNYIFKNTGDLPFENKSKDWGFDLPSYSNGAAYVDLDNDGDLDLIVNNIDEKAFVYQNTLQENSKENPNNYLRIQLRGPAGNPQGIGTKISLTDRAGQQQFRFVSPYRGYLSTVESALHFGLGTENSVAQIKILWPDGKEQILENVSGNQQLSIAHTDAQIASETPQSIQKKTLFQKTASNQKIHFTHRENDFADFKVQPILPHKHSQNGPGIAVGDLNGDQLEDFYIGGSATYPGQFFLQNPDQSFSTKTMSIDSMYEDMGTLFFDADNDGDSDLYVVSGGSSFQSKVLMYQDRLYLNDGQGNFSKAKNALPKIEASGASVTAADYDRDGDLDLLVCGRIVPGEYPLPAQTYLLRNDSQNGQCRFTDVSAQSLPQKGKLGLVSDALWTDYDNDGALDLILAGEWMPLTFFKNNNNVFQDQTASTGLKNTNGWWNSLAAADFDKDGDLDYVAGNRGLNSFYKASPKEPLSVYAKDFDKNGRIDPVLCHYIEGRKYIAPSRDMLIEQINSMKGRFKTYTEYGNATFDRSFTKQEIADAYMLESKDFATSYLENLGNGKFAMHHLPLEAQVAPTFGILAEDIDADGHTDILLVGNSYSSEVMIGPYDACKGVLLKGDGRGGFENSPLSESGFFVDKDAKAFSQIALPNNQSLYLISRNGDSLKSYTQDNNNKTKNIPLQALDSYAEIVLKNGTQYKKEFYYGSTYLSQSSRYLKVSVETREVRIYNSQGKIRQ